MAEACFQTRTCALCPHHCAIEAGKVGLCKARGNVDGSIEALSYSKITSKALDPIEKKPLARFKPNSTVLSIGSFGCNMRCPWCQNASIAQVDVHGCRWQEIAPADIAREAKELERRGCIGVAYTYNEPLTFYEYMLDCCRLVHENGQDNVLVSNGMIEEAPLMKLAEHIDAANIDLKTFNANNYERIGGNLAAVQNTIEALINAGAHVEVTTLVVPGFNDSPDEIKQIAEWLSSFDDQMVLHLTRFFPRHKMRNSVPTPKSCLQECLLAAQAHLPNARLGNV